MRLETVISIVSMVIAVLSALFAYFTFRATQKTNSIELIRQLYESYRSEEMSRDLRIVWDVYHRLWGQEQNSRKKKKSNEPDNADRGIPLPDDVARKYFLDLDTKSDEYGAIENLLNYWTYIQLLARRKMITPKEILAFTSSYILSFLCPIQKAHAYRYKKVKEIESLDYIHEKLRKIQK